MISNADSAEHKSVMPDWYEATAIYMQPNFKKAAWQCINTFIPYLALWGVMLYAIRQGYSYWTILALSVLAAALLVRIFVFFHDCCHNSFFASSRANTVLGYISGILTFTPFADWRRTHGMHHSSAGDLDRRGVGDVWTLTVEEYRQAAMAASYNFGYRAAVLVAGAGALYLADFYDWSVAYLAMTALMGVGFVTALIIREPEHKRDDQVAAMEAEISGWMSGHVGGGGALSRASAWLGAAVVSPFVEFFRRNGRFALVLLALMLCFNISDRVLGIMANPFYLDLGFTKSEIASVSKIFGFFMTLLGAALGGVLVARWGTLRTMLLAAVMLAITNLMFMALAYAGPDIRVLVFTISGDNLSMGLAGVAFIAYLSSLTNQAYTATQYALFSSLMSVLGKFISGWSGVVVEAFGYPTFFAYAAATGLPAIFLILYIIRRTERQSGTGSGGPPASGAATVTGAV